MYRRGDLQKLADLQADFAAALLDPSRPAPAVLRRRTGPSRSRRFGVYRNNVMVGLIEALEAAFPAVYRLVGADFFRMAAGDYVRQSPPRSPVLLLYGETFGEFLDGFEPARAVPYLGDVARLEWARLAAYHAADAAALSLEALAAVPAVSLPELRFRLHPSLHLLRSRFPVASLWAATSEAEPAAAVDMARPEEVAVVRPDLVVDVRVLPPGGHDFIAALAAGRSLGEAAQLVAGCSAEFDLALHLQGLFGLGAVTALQVPGFTSDNPDAGHDLATH